MSLVRVFSLGTIRMAVELVASFLSIKVTSVYLGPAGIGLVGQLQSFIGMVLGIVSNGVNTGIVRLTAEYGQDVERRRTLVSTVARAIFVVGVPVSLAIIVGAAWIAEKLLHQASYAPVVILFGVLYLCGLFGSLLLGLANGARDYTSITLIRVCCILVSLALYILLAPAFGVSGVLVAAVLAPLVSLVIAGLVARDKPWFELRALYAGFSGVELRRMAGFIPLAVSGSLVMPMAQIMVRDRVAIHAGLDAVGLLQGIWRISDLSLSIFMGMFSMHFLPRFAEINDGRELLNEIGRGLLFVVSVVGIIGVVSYLLRDLLIAVIFTPRFQPMRDLFGWQMAGNIVKMAGWLLGAVVVARASPLLSTATEILTGVAWIVFAWWLVPAEGSIGAVKSYVATYTCYLAVTACLVFVIIRRTEAKAPLNR